MIDELSRLIPLYTKIVCLYLQDFFNMAFDFFTLPGEKLACLFFLCVSQTGNS